MTRAAYALVVALGLVAACRCGSRATDSPTAAPVPAEIAVADLERWSYSSGLGLACLDPIVLADLRTTAGAQRSERRHVMVNLPPALLSLMPSALVVYAVDVGRERDELKWLRPAMTIPVAVPGMRRRVPVVVIDRNHLRWIASYLANYMEATTAASDKIQAQLASSTPSRQPIDDYYRRLADPSRGGIGAPVPELPLPEAISRYCAGDPTGTDVYLAALVRDGAVWALRHELRHVWHPTPLAAHDRTRCPASAELDEVVGPEIAADESAALALPHDDVTSVIGPWRDRLNAWFLHYANGEMTLTPKTRYTAQWGVIANLEVATLVSGQAWLASGRSVAIMRRAGLESKAELLSYMRYMNAAPSCPTRAALEARCARCADTTGGCAAVADEAWRCAAILTSGDPAVWADQQRALKELEAELIERGVSVHEDPKSSDNLVVLRLGDPATSILQLNVAHGVAVPHENASDRSDRLYRFLIAGGMFVGPFFIQGRADDASARQALNVLLAWEAARLDRSCLDGDAHACVLRGVAHQETLELAAAHAAYRRGCAGGDGDGCTQDKALTALELRLPKSSSHGDPPSNRPGQ